MLIQEKYFLIIEDKDPEPEVNFKLATEIRERMFPMVSQL